MFENRKLKEAIRQNDAGGSVRQLAKEVSRSKYREACQLAVTCNSVKALKSLFATNRGFDFTSSGGGDRATTKSLINAAKASPASVPLLNILFETNQTTRYGIVDNAYFLNEDTAPEILEA